MLLVAGNTLLCISLYPATDGQQTGNNFVDGNKQHVADNMLPGNMLP